MNIEEQLKTKLNKGSPNLDNKKKFEGNTIIRIDFIIKLRNGDQTIVDAANEQLDQMVPFDQREVNPYDPNNLRWIRTEGQKGASEIYPAFQQKPKLTVDYNNLLNDLKNHDGKLVHKGMYYTLEKDEFTIRRKPSK